MPELNYGESNFSVHQTRSPNRGSRIANVGLVIAVLLLAGVGYYVFAETPRLVQHIANEDALAVASAHVLALKGAPLPDGAVPVLKRALDKGSSPSLRAASATALAVSKERELTPYLGDAANRDPEPDVRAAAVEALAKYAGGGELRFVKLALNDDAEQVRCAALRAVGVLDLRTLIPRLIEKVDAPSRTEREAALAGLEQFMEEGRSFGHDKIKWQAWYDGK